jgi:hypothetical protein
MADFDDPERSKWHVPAMMALVIALYGGSRIAETREVEAVLLAFAFPVGCVVIGQRPFSDASGEVRMAAFATAALTILLLAFRIWASLFGASSLAEAARHPAFDVAALVLFVAALAVQFSAAKNSLSSRFAAWLGVALGVAVYLPSRVGNDRFGSIFGGLFVGFFAGGGAGLLLGHLVSGAARARRR